MKCNDSVSSIPVDVIMESSIAPLVNENFYSSNANNIFHDEKHFHKGVVIVVVI